MKQEQGFSLIEVLIAGGLMIGVVFAVQSLLANTSKSAGDIEKRMRHRDLVEDIRFAFYDNSRCLAVVRSLNFSNGEEVGIPLGLSTAHAGSDLPEYGLRVIHLALRNVQTLPEDSFTLLLPDRSLAGQYLESAKTADLVLEAQVMGASRPLKAVVVQKITWLKRTGALTEELCFGNHDIPGRGGASPAGGGATGTDRRAGPPSEGGSSAAITLYEQDKGIGNGGVGEGVSRRAYCHLTDPQMIQLTGRNRLIDGESVTIPPAGGVGSGYLECSGGKVSIHR